VTSNVQYNSAIVPVRLYYRLSLPRLEMVRPPTGPQHAVRIAALPSVGLTPQDWGLAWSCQLLNSAVTITSNAVLSSSMQSVQLGRRA